jgi:hypothetical protein
MLPLGAALELAATLATVLGEVLGAVAAIVVVSVAAPVVSARGASSCFLHAITEMPARRIEAAALFIRPLYRDRFSRPERS